ncbi:hypothetical protein G6F27_013963 [Rhizopus arrhizus]|nr:hypothetical protein G6F27_013963 [Rhizopus arrhizus]
MEENLLKNPGFRWIAEYRKHKQRVDFTGITTPHAIRFPGDYVSYKRTSPALPTVKDIVDYMRKDTEKYVEKYSNNEFGLNVTWDDFRKVNYDIGSVKLKPQVPIVRIGSMRYLLGGYDIAITGVRVYSLQDNFCIKECYLIKHDTQVA